MSENDLNIPELKILDDILSKLEGKTEKEPMVFSDILWYDNKLFNTNNRNQRTIIEKLIRDGYADFIEDKESKEHLYFITFDGLIFLKKGGYITEFKNESLLNNRIEQINKYTLKKLKYDFFTRWIFFAVALLGLGLSIYNIINNQKI